MHDDQTGVPIMFVWINYSSKERNRVKTFFFGLSDHTRSLLSCGPTSAKWLYSSFLRWQKDEGRFLLEERPIKGKKRVLAVLTCRGKKTVELTIMCVLDSEQGKKFGPSLTHFLNSFLSQCGVEFVVTEVKEEYGRMLNLLKGLGFTIIGKDEDKGYFKLGKKLDRWPYLPVPPAAVKNMAEYIRRQNQTPVPKS